MSFAIEEKDIDKLITKYRFDLSERGFSRLPAEREDRLLSLIRTGNYKETMDSVKFSKLMEHLGTLALDPKKNLEYYVVATITMGLRAAIEGGMPPEDAYDLSDVLLQKLSRASTIDEIERMASLSVTAFAKGVYLSHRASGVYAVEQAKVYISRNIFTTIRLPDIAEFVGLSPEYLSRLFRQTTGMTIQDYIQREKVEVAAKMLRFSDRSIVDIALSIGFQSQSSFGRVFKKWKNVTPTEYRNAHNKDNYHGKE